MNTNKKKPVRAAPAAPSTLDQARDELESALLAAVAREGLSPLGPPTFARYNSPFALWFVRRNEALVEVAERAPRR